MARAAYRYIRLAACACIVLLRYAARMLGGPATAGSVTALLLSRLHPKKRVELLLDAAGLLAPKHPMRLFTAGDGDSAYVSGLKDRAAANGFGNQVIFTGFVAGAEKRRLL